MARWAYTIWLGDVFHNETLTFQQRRDAICDRLADSKWIRDSGTDSDVTELVGELREAFDGEEFDDIWD